MTTREQAVAAAGRCIAEGRALSDSLPPEEAARLAWTPSSPYTVEQLTERIRARRNTSRPAPTLPARPAETSAPVSARRGGAGRGAPKSA